MNQPELVANPLEPLIILEASIVICVASSSTNTKLVPTTEPLTTGLPELPVLPKADASTVTVEPSLIVRTISVPLTTPLETVVFSSIDKPVTSTVTTLASAIVRVKSEPLNEPLDTKLFSSTPKVVTSTV